MANLFDIVENLVQSLAGRVRRAQGPENVWAARAFRQKHHRTWRCRVESLEERRLLTSMPYGATELDLGEFLLGDVAVTTVFLESDGSIDADTEDWDSTKIQQVLDNIAEGLTWWEDTLDAQGSVHELNFTVDTTHALTPFETGYEGIGRRSTDYTLYVRDFLDAQGHSTGNLEIDIRAFNQAQRVLHDTNWSYTMFVVPSFDDADGQFAPGGPFRRAFAFAGGLFMVVPSTRPASTYAHESGHIFWGRDEYPGGGNYFQRRGYYNTQNLNAHDNPTPGFVQEPSIMASGPLLDAAYAGHVSPASTLAMIGWQDSDGDGIFDVLDVPHQLTGTGYYDAANETYHFSGRATVQTLPNLNPAGLQNDITLNRIREIEYRVDGGAWQLHSTPDAYEADLDLEISIPAGGSEIEIRARDSQTTVTSNIFLGRLSRADSTLVPGINGFVWIDDNENGLRDVGEYGPELWTVELVDNVGNPLELQTTIEPDDYPAGQLLNGFAPNLTLTAKGLDTDGRVGVFNDNLTSTGSKSFHVFSDDANSYISSWTDDAHRLQADFASPTSVVMIDVIGTGNQTYGRLEAFNTQGQLLGRATSSALSSGQVETLTIARATNDIAYVIASGHAKTSVNLDFLRFGPDATTVTGPLGQYSFNSLPEGSYNVKVTPSSGHVPIDPASGQQNIFVASSTAVADVDFAYQSTASEWQNPTNQYDVNNDQHVSPLDVLIVINDINLNQARNLSGTGFVPPPFLDVSGDSFVSALDVLLVINHLNSNSGLGEGESDSLALLTSSTTESSDSQANATDRVISALSASGEMDASLDITTESEFQASALPLFWWEMDDEDANELLGGVSGEELQSIASGRLTGRACHGRRTG